VFAQESTFIPEARRVDGRDIFDTVLEETRRFRAALPKLMAAHAGQWVVFKNGAVASAHSDRDTAYRSGLTQFGPTGGHVVDRVEPKHAVPVTAGVVFG